MNILTVTRFNNYTWNENKRWRENNEYKGCIYNSPIYIKEQIPLLEELYVIEMNNDTNKILGFGKIINKLYVNKPYIIHQDRTYNRHTYKGKIRIDINSIHDEASINLIEKLEKKLFKGNGHLKRGMGITQISAELTKEFYPLIRGVAQGELHSP